MTAMRVKRAGALALALVGAGLPTASKAAAVYDAHAYVTLSFGASGGKGLADLGHGASTVVFEGGAQPGEWLNQWEEIRVPPRERVRVYADRHDVTKNRVPPLPASTLLVPSGGLHDAAFVDTGKGTDLSAKDWNADLAGGSAGGFTNSNGLTSEDGKPSVSIATITWGRAEQPGSFVSSSGRWSGTLSFVNLSTTAELTLSWLLSYQMSAFAKVDDPAREFAFSGAYFAAGAAGDTKGRQEAGLYAQAPEATPQWWRDLLVPPEFHDQATGTGESRPASLHGTLPFSVLLKPGEGYTAEFLVDVSGSAYVAPIPLPPGLPLLLSGLAGLGLVAGAARRLPGAAPHSVRRDCDVQTGTKLSCSGSYWCSAPSAISCQMPCRVRRPSSTAARTTG